MTAEIIQLQPIIDTRNFLTRHYNDAVRLSQRHRIRGNEPLSHKWFIISQGIAIKIDRVATTRA